MVFAVAVLLIFCIVLGLYPGLVTNPIAELIGGLL